MLYDVLGNLLEKYPTITGDGVADDTLALQALVNTYKDLHLPANLKIKLTGTILIDPNKLKLFDGGNSTFICYGDFPAFTITGSLTSSMTANPSTLNTQIMGSEAQFKICNCKITSSDAEQASGIAITGCFKTVVENCYIYKLKVGITIANQNRDLIIANNHIYGCWQYGIHIQNTANIHQCNIVANMISYCYYCLFMDSPVQIANFQITGNDIEISTYPNLNDKTGFRAIYINSGDSQSGQLSEIEICGNTIQGHSDSTNIIRIVGGAARYVQHISLIGNHISNSTGSLVILTKVRTVSCMGNTHKDATHCYYLTNCTIATIVGNTGNNVTDMFYDNGGNTKTIVDHNSV